jgi:hypothetical protein
MHESLPVMLTRCPRIFNISSVGRVDQDAGAPGLLSDAVSRTVSKIWKADSYSGH